ncbi:hypothetical protein EA656_08640 [Pseudoxanthomonas winnipegensis]|uniref:Uncharacterized protein n=1 Tax=Pseudoxanthomonas winnipegensis TaxID=2480810 RepID=A0A4Q8LUN3_9GAMM|nr:hypothetical protein EA663_10710 [Pseudoxanthomonas winnipegensis]TAA35732.1 hypothetical protein EA656_08640 [Pseudoxanthomonas winnipegensis]
MGARRCRPCWANLEKRHEHRRRHPDGLPGRRAGPAGRGAGRCRPGARSGAGRARGAAAAPGRACAHLACRRARRTGD